MLNGKRAIDLSVNVEGFIIDVYYQFRRSEKRNQLKEFMNFSNNELLYKSNQSHPYNVVKYWKMFRENFDAMGFFGIIFSV